MTRAPYTALCVDCRTLLPDGTKRCDASARHEVVNADSARGRRRWLFRVWGSRKRRARAKATGNGFPSFLGCLLVPLVEVYFGCLYYLFEWLRDGGLNNEPVAFLFNSGLWLTFGIGAVLLVRGVSNNKGAVRNRLEPRGARRGPYALKKGVTLLRGRVQGVESIVSAGSQTACRAYRIQLVADQHKGATATMLQHARGSRFEVVLDNGSVVEIDADRLRIEGPEQAISKVDAKVTDHLRVDLDASDGMFVAAPYERVLETLVCDGDEVEIAAEFERRIDAVDGSPYRDKPRYRYLATGSVGLRVMTMSAA